MEKITTIGLDIAKHVFQVHVVNSAGTIMCRRRLSRAATMSLDSLRHCRRA